MVYLYENASRGTGLLDKLWRKVEQWKGDESSSRSDFCFHPAAVCLQVLHYQIFRLNGPSAMDRLLDEPRMRRFGLFVRRHQQWVDRAAWALFALQALTLLSRTSTTSATTEDLLAAADCLLAMARAKPQSSRKHAPGTPRRCVIPLLC